MEQKFQHLSEKMFDSYLLIETYVKEISISSFYEFLNVYSLLFPHLGICGTLHLSFPNHCGSAEDVGVPVSSVATNMQELTLQEDPRPKPEEDDHSVIIPNHLQVQHADFSHLSFGSFRSGISSSFSGPFASRSVKNSLEDASTVADTPVGHSETRYVLIHYKCL